MVTITKIDPKDIPEVSNKFLMRGNQTASTKDKDDKASEETSGRDRRRETSTDERNPPKNT